MPALHRAAGCHRARLLSLPLRVSCCPLLCQLPQFNRSGCWMPAHHALLTLAGLGTPLKAVHSISLISVQFVSSHWQQPPITVFQQESSKIGQAALAHNQRCTLFPRNCCTAHTQAVAAHSGWWAGCLTQLQSDTREAVTDVRPCPRWVGLPLQGLRGQSPSLIHCLQPAPTQPTSPAPLLFALLRSRCAGRPHKG